MELHLSIRDWAAHGHHKDCNYNSVTLHAVAGTADKEASLRSGMEAPAISLAPLMEAQATCRNPGQDALYKLLSEQGYQKPSSRGEALRLLERSGTDRFLGKSRWYQRQTRDQPAEEVVYQGLMEAAGYSENRGGFSRLSQKAPYGHLSRLAETSSRTGLATVEQYLLAAAGFGRPSPHSQFLGSPMSSTSWRLFRVRPSNNPRRRIRGMASLIVRYRDGMITGLMRLVLQESGKTLEKGLMVDDPGGGPALIGHSRASDMAINVVLPFLHGWGSETDNKSLQGAALNLFQGWPSLQINSAISSAEEALFPERWLPLARGARGQQGVLHLQRLLRGEKAEAVDLSRV
ncbi:MAG: DUF2851 family protein [SAR202 cluster bacterium]|nr:DUF2851 family protein [SAR202 cluster bacterium]